jgi:acyl dehydratase
MSALPPIRIDEVQAAPMVEWVRAMNDDNPIHVDPAVAHALGFGPRTVNPGPMNLAYAMNLLLAATPDRPIAAIEARFLGNVLSGDAVRAEGTLEGDAATLRLVRAKDGAVLVDAVARLRE